MIHSLCACIKVVYFMNPVLCMYVYAYLGILLHILRTYTQRCYHRLNNNKPMGAMVYHSYLTTYYIQTSYFTTYYFTIYYFTTYYFTTYYFTTYCYLHCISNIIYIYWACTAHTRMNL